MLKFVVLEKETDTPILEDAIYGHSFKVFNTSLDAWSHLLKNEYPADYMVAQIDINIVNRMGDNE